MKFPNLKPGQVHTMETIKARTVEEGDCWLWQAGTSHGTPALRHDGRIMQVRRYIFTQLLGRETQGRFVTMRCDHLNCVNPDHIVLQTRHQLQQRTARRTQYGSNPARNLKIARAKQAASHLTWERVREIRAMEGTSRGIARALGMTFSTVHMIRLGASWQEAGPFMGMFMTAKEIRRAA